MGAGINMQNLIWKFSDDLKDMALDHRGVHTPRPGHVFIISDLAQIEPRCLNWLAGNKVFLGACKTMSLYQAAAIAQGTWSMDRGDLKQENKDLYALTKAQVLALGYGASHNKFIIMMGTFGMDAAELLGTTATGVEIAEFKQYLARLDEMTKSKMWSGQIKGLTKAELCLQVNARNIVKNWRAQNPKITSLWNTWGDKLMEACKDRRDCFSVTMPSGRELKFWHPRLRREKKDGVSDVSMTCYKRAPVPGRNNNTYRRHIYGAMVAQNLNQGFARDVLGHHMIRIDEELGLPILWSVHDEVIVECPETKAEEMLIKIRDIMSTAPDWAPGLPIACEAEIADRYQKAPRSDEYMDQYATLAPSSVERWGDLLPGRAITKREYVLIEKARTR